MVVSHIGKGFSKVFGSRNERMLKAYGRRVAQVNAIEDEVRRLTDAQLRDRTKEFRRRHAEGERIGDLLPPVMAVAREAMDRAVGIRNILNPEHAFDPATLPAEVRSLYQQVKDEADALEPQPVFGGEPAPGWMQVEIPNALYDAVRAMFPQSRPPFRARPFDVQLIGGMVLGEGRIAEMKTGEGKTIVAPLACYVACVENLQCHVVTVNDYLVQRDRDWVFPFYYWLGLTVGTIHPHHMQDPRLKQQAYHCDVVYGTNSEFGFDYLRDNMKMSTAEQVQKRRDFCIIDEVDSILIDEARTPLIISGPAHEDTPRYELADKVARHLIQKQRQWDAANEKVEATKRRITGLEGDIRNTRDKSRIPAMKKEKADLEARLPDLEDARDLHTQYYEVEPEKKASHLTHQGVAEAQKIADIGSFYVGNNMDFPHLLENSLRAHAVYQRDKDYVVQNGEVIIVDEFTGRLMVGRQWSDGLHQAVEAKEHVKIKQETQTLATVTIQNFFKLYKRLAGMTGTAITEATEFNEIYGLDVVCIPTNVPVVRKDMDDLIFISEKDKWDAIVDEIKHVHDVGRPVLVGTTSVERSEMLSQRLTKKYGVQHEVLNAKQHEREAHIVAHAGELGAVMIATNMAGRGTDIKLGPIDRETLVRHWQVRNILPKQARPEMDDDRLIELAYRHLATRELDMKPKEVEALAFDELRDRLLRHWVQQMRFMDPRRVMKLTLEQCLSLLDEQPSFMFHRLKIYEKIEQMGGLHIVGTERHEARRIDNQLRGRSGRQGDRGSSRFFISLEDDLMKMFAGKTTMAALSKLGMKEGDALVHKWITRSVERAQRKVEERNYEIRKNLLEYDEVMEYQRNDFYALRQDVLEGRDIQKVIFEYIAESTADAVDRFLDNEYVPNQIADWCHQVLDVSIESFKLRGSELEDLLPVIRREGETEITQTIEVTIGEYMPQDVSPTEWDLRGLSSWAMSRFGVDLPQSRLRKMSPDDVREQLTQAAIQQFQKKDITPITKFLDPLYPEKQLAEWARQKFEIDLDPQGMAEMDPEQVVDHILKQARAAYRQRELIYPIEFAVEMTFQAAQRGQGQQAAQQLAAWCAQRYGLEWTPEQITKLTREELYDKLIAEARRWVEGDNLRELAKELVDEHSDPKELAELIQQHLAQPAQAEEIEPMDRDARVELVVEKGKALLRMELTQLERYVLLQILDQSWKDHLYLMDQLKSAVSLKAYAEKDPRIEYKREGANQYALMRRQVRDRVTDLIFRVRLTPDSQPARNVYTRQQTHHAEVPTATGSGKAGHADGESLDATQRAVGEDGPHVSRKQRRAAEKRARVEQGATRVKPKRRRH